MRKREREIFKNLKEKHNLVKYVQNLFGETYFFFFKIPLLPILWNALLS